MTNAARHPSRRRDIALSYANAGLWGVGNGLVGSSLVVYFARSLGAAGLGISLIVASPQLVGVLRLLAPLLLDRLGNRRAFCLVTFLSSAAILGLLPWLAWPGVLPGTRPSLAVVIGLWSLYHLAEFFGVVALWSWLRDLVPDRVLGRYVGRRTAWMNAGKVAGTLAGIVVNTYPQWFFSTTDAAGLRILAYALCMVLGTLLLAAAALPLIAMHELASPSGVGRRPARERLREALVPFADRQFRRFLTYGAWFSFSNGITGAAQYLYLINVVKLPYGTKRALETGSQALQPPLMPAIGRWIDRGGAVRPMMVSQVLVAVGLVFFLPASESHRWWLLAAYACWVGYAGLNVGMPHLMLHLARPECSGAYVAAWQAWTKLVYGLTYIGGGLLVDWLSDNFPSRSWGGWQLDHLVLLIAAGAVLRLLGLVFLARIREHN